MDVIGRFVLERASVFAPAVARNGNVLEILRASGAAAAATATATATTHPVAASARVRQEHHHRQRQRPRVPSVPAQENFQQQQQQQRVESYHDAASSSSSVSAQAARLSPFDRESVVYSRFKLRAPANSIFGARRNRQQPQRPLSKALAAFNNPTPVTTPLLRFISSRSFSSTTSTRCSCIIPSSIMADRDTLSENVKPSHYNLSISSLEFKNWSFQGRVT